MSFDRRRSDGSIVNRSRCESWVSTPAKRRRSQTREKDGEKSLGRYPLRLPMVGSNRKRVVSAFVKQSVVQPVCNDDVLVRERESRVVLW